MPVFMTKEKNKKTNKGGSYRLKIAKKYKKSQTRGIFLQTDEVKK